MNILRNEARIAYIKLIFNAKSKLEERNVDLNGYYEIINNIILALKDCIVESKKMDIEKDFING